MAQFFDVSQIIIKNSIPPLKKDHKNVIKYIDDNILYVSFNTIIDDTTEYYDALRKGAAELKLYGIVRQCALAKTKFDMVNVYTEMKFVAALVGMNMLKFPNYINPVHHRRRKLIKTQPSFLKYPNPHLYVEPRRPSPPKPQENKKMTTDLQITIAEYEEKVEQTKKPKKCCVGGLAELFGSDPYSCDSYDRLIYNHDD